VHSEPTPRQSLEGTTRTGRQTTAAPTTRHVPTLSLLDVSRRLRPRDLAMAHLIAEHTVLTTPQLATIFFNSPITCQHRLQTLRKIGFLGRFVRNHPSQPRPLCWVSGPLSARYVAMVRGDTVPTLKAIREQQERVMSNPSLDHLIGANEFFVKLLAYARSRETTRLARWWPERIASARYGGVRPDGHGVWEADGRQVGFFLEYDTGTEPLGKLVGKLTKYRQLINSGGPVYPVLFVLPNRIREQNLHRKLAAGLDPGVVVATTSPEAGTDPAGPVWKRFGNGRARYTLAELPSAHGEPHPIKNAGAPDAGDDPLRGLCA
jgi:hypothetical protein